MSSPRKWALTQDLLIKNAPFDSVEMSSPRKWALTQMNFPDVFANLKCVEMSSPRKWALTPCNRAVRVEIVSGRNEQPKKVGIDTSNSYVYSVSPVVVEMSSPRKWALTLSKYAHADNDAGFGVEMSSPKHG